MLLAKLEFESLLIIDPSPKQSNDKTWCFWSTHDFQYQCAQKQSWKQLSFKTDGFEKTESIAPYTYYHIQSLDFYDEVRALIEADSRIHWVQEKLVDLEDTPGAGIVKTDQALYTAQYVFNSVIRDSSWKSDQLTYQHFFGQTIVTDQDVFNPEEVYLMDFRMPNQKSVQFGYLLPFSPKKALIEYTEFSANVHSKIGYRSHIKNYFDTLGVKHFEVLEEETGAIPMTSHTFSKSEGTHIHHLGTAGGLTKPTTGYTFRNIQLDSQLIVNSLKEKNTVLQRRQSAGRFRFYDRLLLGIIQQEPAKVKKIMSRLFRRNQFAHILSFLDEESNLLNEMRIFCSIPWSPFLRQLIKW